MEQQPALFTTSGTSAFAYALETAGIGFWELDCGSGRVATSWQHDRIFGCEQPCASWQLPDWHAHIFVDDRDGFAAQLALAKLVGTLAFECRIKRKDDALRWVALSAALRVDTASKRRLLAGVIVDITDSRRRELQAAAPGESDFADSIFITQMHHEIRTPLHSIQGFNFLLQKSTLTPGQQEYVRKIEMAAQVLLSALDGIADYSKIEMGALKFDSVDFRIDRLLEEVEAKFAPMCEVKSVSFVPFIASDVPLSLRGDARKLQQILLSLGRYALCTTHRGEIALSVFVLQDAVDSSENQVQLYFSLRDTGVGVSAAQVQQAFDAFHRVDRNSRSGVDIGVAVSKRVIELLGGTLTLSSVIGKGSEFNFNLPFARCGNNDAVTSSTALPRAMDRAIGDIRVLLVDDDSLNLLVARAMLKHIGVTHIDTATTGLEAADFVEHHGGDYYQLILMDLQMPVMDGYVAAREIRRCPGAETVPIVAMTADVLTDGENCFIAGMNEYLTKPINIPQLTALIERTLDIKIAAQ